MIEIKTYSPSIFEALKKLTDEGIEFWYARDLQNVLEYKQWRNLLKVIEKAKEACRNSGYELSDHIADVSNMVEIGSGA